MSDPRTPARWTAAVLCACSLAPTRAADPAAGTDLPPVTVTGSRAPTTAAAGTKGDTPLLETPQSISVISRDNLDVRGVANLNQALRYTAGITPETRGANAEVYDLFKLRGFDAPQYLDGLKIYASPTGYAATQIDLSRLDRIEVVKGPASVLYGQSSPGGLIALTSKLPHVGGHYGSVEATIGTFDLYRLDGDVGGALNADGSVLYRVSGTVNGAHTQQTFGERQRTSISPAITFGAGGDTTLTLLAALSHDPRNGNYGVQPLSGTVDPNPNGQISRKFADGEPALQRYARDQSAVTYLLDHQLGGGWAVHANGRFQRVSASAEGVYTTGIPTDASLRTFGRGSLRTDEGLSDWTFDNRIDGSVTTGAVTHKLLFGLDYQHAASNEGAGFGAATDIDAFAPVYGTTTTLPTTTSFYQVRQRQLGVYAQDQLSLGGLRLTLSGRYDQTRGQLQEAASATDSEKDDHKLTYRVGGLYLFDNGLAPYASVSTSFEPQSSSVARADGSTGIADPSVGKQLEAGLKYQPAGTTILLTAAVFRIDQTHVVVSNPITFSATQSGKVRSQGVEFEAKLPVVKNLDLTASYSRQRVRTLQDDNAFNVGHPLIGVAEQNAGLFANYRVDQGALAGVNVGGGVRYVGSTYGGYLTDAAGTSVSRYVSSSPYTVVDAVVGMDLGRFGAQYKGLTLALNVANLFDRRYVNSCYVNFVQWCWYGQQRTVQATLGAHW